MKKSLKENVSGQALMMTEFKNLYAQIVSQCDMPIKLKKLVNTFSNKYKVLSEEDRLNDSVIYLSSDKSSNRTCRQETQRVYGSSSSNSDKDENSKKIKSPLKKSPSKKRGASDFRDQNKPNISSPKAQQTRLSKPETPSPSNIQSDDHEKSKHWEDDDQFYSVIDNNQNLTKDENLRVSALKPNLMLEYKADLGE